MRTPTQKQILSAFRGATKSEIAKVAFPLDFDDVLGRIDDHGDLLEPLLDAGYQLPQR